LALDLLKKSTDLSNCLLMKAYEFYVLLGKYKRMSLTRSEFERFRNAVETVRRFRHSFYESTGEYYPVARRRSSRKDKTTSHPNARALKANRPKRGRATSVNRTNSSVEQEGHGSQKQSPEFEREQKLAKKSDEQVTEILDHHREFRRVRNNRRRKKFRWFRLGRDIARNHPFKLFLSLVFLVAILIVAIIRPGSSKDLLRSSSSTNLEELKEKSTELDIGVESLTSGRFMSEADKLMAIDPKSFELDVETQINANAAGGLQPAVGLEQAIKDGLDSRFPKPEEALPELDLPDLQLQDPMGQP